MVKKVIQKESESHSIAKCTICLQRNTNATLNCLHKFCYRCINRWRKNQPRCPICRREIQLIESGNKRFQFPPVPPARQAARRQTVRRILPAQIYTIQQAMMIYTFNLHLQMAWNYYQYQMHPYFYPVFY